jgi:hypothetical protein
LSFVKIKARFFQLAFDTFKALWSHSYSFIIRYEELIIF